MKNTKRYARVIAGFLLLIIALTSCASDSPTVMKIGKLDVSYDMLRYFARGYMEGYEDITPEDFLTDSELQKSLDENVKTSLSELAAYVTLADKYSIKLDKDDKAEIDEQMEAMRAEYKDDEAYRSGLDEANATEAVVRRIYEIQKLCDKLYEHMTSGNDPYFKSDNATIDADIDAGNWFSAEFILVTYSPGDKESRREYMEGVIERISKGEELADIYEDDRTIYGLGIQYEKIGGFTYTQQKEYFEEAVTALETGDCSELIDGPDGFLIVKRLPLDSAYIDKNYVSVFCAGYLEREFFGLVEETAASLEIKYAKKYEDIKFYEIS